MSTNAALPLFDRFSAAPGRRRFSGDTYDPAHDDARLSGQIARVFAAMKSGRWMTLSEIEAETGDPQASISAQLRHLRKPRFGGHDVQKRPRGDRDRGLYEYRLVISEGRS